MSVELPLHAQWSDIQRVSRNPIPALADLTEEALGTILQHFLWHFAEYLTTCRKICPLDAFREMTNLRPQLELHLVDLDLWLFSFDGYIGMEKHERCLLAGRPALIRANTEAEAIELAKNGLDSTVELANHAALAIAMGAEDQLVTPQDPNEGLIIH